MRTPFRKNQRGAALIETAITLPIILLISVAIFEFGNAYQTWQILTNAAREGARVSILPGRTDDDVRTTMREYMRGAGLRGWSTAPIAMDRTMVIGPDTVSQVTISYPYSFIVLNPVVRLIAPSSNTGQPITMTSIATMRNE